MKPDLMPFVRAVRGLFEPVALASKGNRSR
jgi:hypothetical protein